MARTGAPEATAALRSWVVASLAGLLMAGAPCAAAQTTDEPPARALTGVLKRIKETGVVRLGYREHAVPFSYAGSDGRPYGYSIDICHAIVESIAEAVGGTAPRVEYRRVTPLDRFDQVAAGQVDLECGSTTNTAERRKRVAFSPLTFIAGTRLLVARGSPVRSVRDLAGRTIVVARGTMTDMLANEGYTVEAVEDFPQALEWLASGKAAALAADDILIAGYLAEKGLARKYAAVGDLLSFEPYGIMYSAGDGPFGEAVDMAFRRLATTREIRSIYNKWFLRTLPSGFRLGLPMEARLERSFQVLGLPSD